MKKLSNKGFKIKLKTIKIYFDRGGHGLHHETTFRAPFGPINL
jgi:hypothetical protein